jgi:hypothetical protein
LLLVVVAAGLRLAMPGPPIFVVDEILWSTRSERFATALAEGDFASANVGPADEDGTRPGVTTMWIGVLGDQVADADPLGVGAGKVRWTHALMGIACSLMLWPFVVLAARLVGRRAAVAAGALVAVEPLMVGHSAIQHTDALVAMTVGVAAVAMVGAFEAARAEVAEPALTWWRRASVRLGAVAGAFAALGCLTKLSAALLLGTVVLVVVGVHLGIWWRAARPPGQGRSAAAVLAAAAGVFVLVALAIWPALWVDPIANVRSTLSSRELASSSTRHLFLGEARTGADWRFYPVELWFRASPWLLVSGVSAIGWALWRWTRRWPRLVARRIAIPVLLPPVVYAVAITASDKQYSRYLLPLLPFAAIGLGVTAHAVAQVVRPWARAAGWAALAAAGVFTAALAPYAISFVDPLVGGQRRAEDAIQLGWGEAKEAVIADYERRTDDECAPWSGVGPWFLACPKQDFGWLGGDAPAPRFVLTYIADRQLDLEPQGLRRYLSEHGELVDVVRIDGVEYAELWELAPP